MALVAENKDTVQPRSGVAATILRSKLAHNVISLYAGQTAMYLAPLITVPYLTRVLGEQEWGRYSFALAVSVQLGLLVEYGFFVSANRAVATHRDDAARMGSTLGAVLFAKVILIGVAGVLAAIAYSQIPLLRERTGMFWFAATAGITQGLNFSWYLYGIEKMALAVSLDLGNRLLVAAAMISLIHSSGDGWRFFVLQTAANIAVASFGLAYVLRRNKVLRPSARNIAAVFRDGTSAMLSRCGFGVFTGLNTFVLGLYANAAVVGFYAGAERIARVVTVFPTPISQALFPRISHLSQSGSSKLSSLRTMGGTATIVIGALTSIVTFLLAPLVTRLLLGPGYETSSVVLRILSPLPLLFACNQVLLCQYLFPDGEFRFVALILTFTTVAVLSVLVILGRASKPNAMALAADVAEAAALGLLLGRVWRRNNIANLPVK